MRLEPIVAVGLCVGLLLLLAGQTPGQTMSNVRELGAKGDGATDDTAVFQNALDALGKTGGSLFVPRGNYRITRTLRVTGGSEPTPGSPLNWTEIRGEGEGSRLLGDGVDYILGVQVDKSKKGVDGRYVQGLRVDGIHFASFDIAEEKRCGGIDASSLIRWTCQNSHFVNLNTGIYAAAKDAEEEVPVFIIRILNNHFTNCLDYAIRMQHIFDLVIANNIIEHGRGGIAVGSPGDGYDAAANSVRIENNVIEGLHAYGKPAILGSCWVGGRIVGNYFEANPAGDLVLTPGEKDGWLRGLIISSNTFQPTTEQIESNAYGPIQLAKVIDTIITGNFTTGPTLIHPASTLFGKSVNIASNILNNPKEIGTVQGAKSDQPVDYVGAQAAVVGNERWTVQSPAATVGIDAARGFVYQPRGQMPRTIAYADAPPLGNQVNYEAGSLIINQTPTVTRNKVLFGWTCVVSGQPGVWKPLYISVE